MACKYSESCCQTSAWNWKFAQAPHSTFLKAPLNPHLSICWIAWDMDPFSNSSESLPNSISIPVSCFGRKAPISRLLESLVGRSVGYISSHH